MSTDIKERYTQASVKTADNLRSIAHSKQIQDLSTLSLPEIDAVVDLIAQVIPAGNVPGVILSGLARLTGRKPPLDTVKRDINLIFKGIKQTLDEAVYTAFFAGPAVVIWGYQNLLKLAGKNPEDAFPEGTWQFYTDYALREDTARHANESHGFDTLLNKHHIHLAEIDRMTAWVMAAIHTLHQYNDLLRNEWRERVYIYVLAEITRSEPDGATYARLAREWEKQRPYGRGHDSAAHETYPVYRRLKFDRFLEAVMAPLKEDLRRRWLEQIQQAKAEDLPAYQRQMTILAYLEPGSYGESRIPIELSQAQIGLVYRGHYYLLPACAPGSDRPPDVDTIRAQIAALTHAAADVPAVGLVQAAGVRRQAWADLRPELTPSLRADLDRLKLAPVLLNFDRRPPDLPLSELRQAERGVGDHALTIFDTGETFVFDQSHIFFDGAWGAALAEIMTNEATAWAVYLGSLSPSEAAQTALSPLACRLQPDDLDRLGQAPRVTPEVSAETGVVNVKAMLALRKLFKQRNDLLELTVNDLLVLYRAIHGLTYKPKPELVQALRNLAGSSGTGKAATAALEAIEEAGQTNPVVVIPVDASRRSPRERLYPMTFEVPVGELDLLTLSRRVIETLDAYENAVGYHTSLYTEFDRLQRIYLATLAGFGAVLSKAKEIAVTGESSSVGTIKLLAHMPGALQHLLDQFSGRFDVLNDIIKGREVFSNVGAVAPTSSLTRFITAKDDNEKKTLAWGFITDAQGAMRVTLRDFRPHVGLLKAAGCQEVAVQITQDYLDTYAHGLNRFIRDLQRVTLTSRETRFPTGKAERV